MKSFIQLLKNYGKENDVKIYIVGGYIRDKLLGIKKEPKDLDVIIEKDIDDLINYLKKEEYKVFVVKEELNIFRVFKGDLAADVTLLKGTDIEEDLGKRDFTINAIALELTENKIIDIFEGRKHLKSNIVQQVNENSIKDDPVRILRAARFIITYGMHLNIFTEASIREQGEKLLSAPKERLFNEFMKIIENDKGGNAFNILDNMMVLNQIIPDLEKLKVIGRCKYHVVDAFTHMNTTYSTFKDLVDNKIQLEVDFNQYLNKKISLYKFENFLAISAFVHDIGKSQCYKKEGDKVSFEGHDYVGAKICEGIFETLGFPKDAIALIKNVVKGHMYPLALYKSSLIDFKKSYFKFFSKYKDYIPYILLISYCDFYATQLYLGISKEAEEYKKFIISLFKEFKRYNNFYDRDFLRGNEISEILNIEGKEIGEAIEYLHKEYYLENVNNIEQGINILKCKFVKKSGKR